MPPPPPLLSRVPVSTPALLLALLLASPARAQAPLPPQGAEVQVETVGGAHLSGVVRSSALDSLALERNATLSIVLPRDAVRSYRMRDGVDRMLGAQWGLLVGGAVGVVVIAVGLHEDAHPTQHEVNIPSFIVTLPVAFASTLLGGLIGVAAAPDRWGPEMRVSAEGGSGARRVGLRVMVP